MRGERDGRRGPQHRRARRPRPRRAARRPCAAPPPAPRRGAARDRGGGRCTRRSSPRGHRPPGRGPGTATSRSIACSRASACEVAAQRPGVGRDEDAALAEDRVAGEAHRAGDEREMVGRMSRRGDHLERPELVAVGEPHARAARVAATRAPSRPPARARPRRGRHGRASARSRRAPASAHLGLDRLQVCVDRGPGIDDPARIAPDDPGVRPAQRERPWVVGAHESDIVLVQERQITTPASRLPLARAAARAGAHPPPPPRTPGASRRPLSAGHRGDSRALAPPRRSTP